MPEVKVNSIYMPLFENQSRFLNLYGSAGSGKSIFASQKIVRRCCQERGHKILAIRKVASTIKDSVFSEFVSRIEEFGIGDHIKINKTDKTIYFDNGSVIICKGLDEPEKMKSIEGITGTWMEEATDLEEEDFDQIVLRVRGEKKYYVQHILSYNPVDENHWIKKRMVDNIEWGGGQIQVFKTTYHDNAFLDQAYTDYLNSLALTNPLYHQVYCLGEWGIVDKSNKFLFNFDKATHTSRIIIDPTLQIRLSFDFNIDPFCVAVYQRFGDEIRVLDKIRLPNSDIEQVCDRVIARYGEQLFIVTGDVAGNQRSGHVRGKKTYWQVIKYRLRLGDAQIRLRAKNLDLVESRILCNHILGHFDITIDERLTDLIEECMYAKVDDKGILIKDRVANKLDQFDTFRYLLDAEFPDAARKPEKYGHAIGQVA